jgi:hypothetical protein
MPKKNHPRLSPHFAQDFSALLNMPLLSLLKETPNTEKDPGSQMFLL